MKKMWRPGDRFPICAARIVKARFHRLSHTYFRKCSNFKSKHELRLLFIQSAPGVSLPPLMVSLPVSLTITTNSSQDPVTFRHLVRQVISNFKQIPAVAMASSLCETYNYTANFPFCPSETSQQWCCLRCSGTFWCLGWDLEGNTIAPNQVYF